MIRPETGRDNGKGCPGNLGERAGIRTLDLLIKSQLLYRLSYTLPKRQPVPWKWGAHTDLVRKGQLPCLRQFVSVNKIRHVFVR
jgi:hypothetical protein